MPDAADALPARPLQARPPLQVRGYVGSLLVVLLFGGMLGYSLFWVAPVLATDWQVRDAAVPIRGARLADGSCFEKLFIHTCDVTLSAPGGIERTVHYGFAAFATGDFTAGVVADPKRPEWLTTDLGLDRFWNRTACLLVEAALLLAFIGRAVQQAVRSLRHRAAWRRAALAPVALQFVQRQAMRNGAALWTVRAPNGRTASWTVPGKAKPFALGAGGQVLGLGFPNGGSVMPLDSKLDWVDLSADERRAALAQQGA